MAPFHEHLSEDDVRGLICDLCRHFYSLGWASGTGGGVSIRRGDNIYMAPSGVQKERLHPEDIFTLDLDGQTLHQPGHGLCVSECKPLFLHAFNIRNAGAVLHSHSINAVAATLIFDHEFQISNLEMLKGIKGVGAFDTHKVPIIPNTARESDLADSLQAAIRDYPEACAVLVKGHGVYVWGDTWEEAKTQAECYDYLFGAAVCIKQLGLDPATGGQS